MRVWIVGQSTLAHVTRTCQPPSVELTASDPDLLWICYDTPIGANDEPDAEWVMDWIHQHLVNTDRGMPILVSSQMPVGTIARLEGLFPGRRFAYSPENIRVKTGVADFLSQARILVGRRSTHDDDLWRELFAPFTSHLILTDPETAEMAKHALNAYLAMNIAFINEIARVSAVVGANVETIAEALLLESRVSPKAPLRPGPPYGGGHLARDLSVLNIVAKRHGVPIPILEHIAVSNAVVGAAKGV